jgi:exopolysaccharide biosynthesis polyprenyl glycosylphosphotransferase
MARDARYRRGLALADVASALVALAVGTLLVGDPVHMHVGALALVPLIALVAKAIGLYDRDEHLLRKTTLDEAPSVFQVATCFALVAWLAQPLLVRGDFGREQIFAIWVVLFVVMLTLRLGARVAVRLTSDPERILFIGDAPSADRVCSRLGQTHGVRVEIVGRVPLVPEHASQNGSTIGAMDTLGIVLIEHEVHRAVIAADTADSEDMLHAIRLVKSLGVKVSVLPRLFEVVGSSVEFDDIDGVTLLGVRRFGLTRSSALLKRSLDVVGASVGLVVLAPTLAMVAVAIRLTTPGPALFRQTRIGRRGERFTMLKFRTMCDDADSLKADLAALSEADGLFKMSNDPRITPVGGFLRRTSLDELPQLMNVLKGDMSLVGPRPLIPNEDAQVEGWRRRRLHVQPGMTGLWQIFGSSRIPMHEMVKIDYLYGANWSLWLDLKILARTIPYALGRRGM